MKLTKMTKGSSINSRRITTQELIYRYVFGDRVPKQFTPGLFYNEGDLCYTIDETGATHLYLCTMAGFYDTLLMRGWIIATLRTDVQDILNKALGIEDYSHKVIFDIEIYKGIDIVKDKITAVLPTTPDPGCNVSIYADGMYFSEDLGDYTLENRTITFNKPVLDSNTVTVYIKKPKNHNAKLFLYYDVAPSNMDIATLTFDISGIENKFSTVCNLYYKGVLISGTKYDYTVDDVNEKIVLHMKDHISVEAKMEDFVLSTVSSRNPYLVIERTNTDYEIIDQVMRYRLEMEKRIDYEWSDMIFRNGYNIPSDKVCINGNIASIKDKDYYGIVSDIITIVDDTYYYIDVVNPSHEIVTEKNERIIPVPILNMTDDIDVLIFKSSGLHVSESRYFTDDGFIYLYPHDNSIAEGDRIVVQPMNYDKEVTIRHHITDVKDDMSIRIDKYINNNVELQLMVFHIDGRYIGRDSYTINDNTITFKLGVVNPEDMVEIVYNYYEKDYTHTVMKTYTTTITNNNVIQVKDFDYRPDMDTIILFDNTTGLYINPNNFIISENGIITVKAGSGIVAGSSVDVVIVRNLDFIIYTEAVDVVRNNLV